MRNIIIITCLFMVNIGFGQGNINLVLPQDTDTIETKNPLLNWTYLSAVATSNRNYYTITIVELEDNQSAAAGILVNPPLVYIEKVPGTQLFYPYDAPELEEGHRYGWQLHRVSNDVIVDQSEAWEFILPLPPVVKPQYIRPKTKADATVYNTQEGILFFYFKDQYSSGDLNFRIYDSVGDIVSLDAILNPSSDEEEQEKNFQETGNNHYQLDIGKVVGAGNYKLVIFDSKDQKYFIKFKID